MVTTNQKSIIDIHPTLRQESKCTTDNHQITREESKKKKGKTNYQTHPQNNEPNGSKYIAVVVSHLNTCVVMSIFYF